MRRFIRFLFLTVDGLLVALFAIGFITYYVPSHILWWTEFVAIGLPYLGLVLLMMVPALAFTRRWRWVAVHGALLVLLLIRVLPVRGLFHHAQPSDQDLTLLTFNVPRWGSDDEMAEKAAGMAGVVRDVSPDLIALQEASITYYADGRLVAEPYVAGMYDSLGYHTVSPGPGTTTFTPQPVLARVPLFDQAEVPLLYRNDGHALTRVTRTVASWKGRRFALYNVHLRSFGDDKPWRDRDTDWLSAAFLTHYARQYETAYRSRTDEVEKIVSLLRQEALPYLVVGDLNSTPYNWAYARLSDGLQDAFRVAGEGWGMTYHRRLPLVRIDYVLASDAFEVVSARVVHAAISDHLPLAVRLRWRAQP